MAQRRMFSQKVTETDKFLDMALTAQSLYFHLGMSADDDGFVGNPKSIKRMIGASDDDLKALVEKDYIIVFDDGVIAIKDWLVSNYVKKDRYTTTIYSDDRKLLAIDRNKRYQFASQMEPDCPHSGTSMEPKRIQDGYNLEPHRSQNGSKNDQQNFTENSQPQQGQGVSQMEPEWNQSGTEMDPQVRLGKSKDNLSKSKDSLNLTKTTTSTSSAESKLKSLHIKLNRTQQQILADYVSDLSLEVVCFAIDSMAQYAETPRFNYLCYILSRYQQSGIHTLKQAQNDDAAYHGKATSISGGPHIPIYKLGE